MSTLLSRLTLRPARGGTLLFAACLILTLCLPAPALAQSTPPHRAGLVIRYGDGSIQTRCVSFSEPSLTGADLLMRSGLPVVLDARSSVGAGVCKIGAQGCNQGQSCFCQCEGSTCAYWQYFHLQNGAWTYSIVGAALYQVSDGMVEGWAWGSNVAPPVMSLDQVCATGAVAPATASAPAAKPTLPPPSSTPAVTQTSPAVTLPATVQTVATTAPATSVVPTESPTAASTTVAAAPVIAPTATATALTPAPAGGQSVLSYVIFGVIVLGAGIGLALQASHGAR